MKVRASVASILILFSLAACEKSDSPKQKTPTAVASKSKTATTDYGVKACQAIPTDRNKVLKNLDDLKAGSKYAVKSNKTGIAAAGEQVLSTLDRKVRNDEEIYRATLKLIRACVEEYGADMK